MNVPFQLLVTARTSLINGGAAVSLHSVVLGFGSSNAAVTAELQILEKNNANSHVKYTVVRLWSST